MPRTDPRIAVLRGMTPDERARALIAVALRMREELEVEVIESGFTGLAQVEYRRLRIKGYKKSKARWCVEQWAEARNKG